MSIEPPQPCPADEQEELEAKKRATKNVGKVAAALGLSPRSVNEAFHPIKHDLVGNGNPDVWVDPKTGWCFAQLGPGQLGECLDNLLFWMDP